MDWEAALDDEGFDAIRRGEGKPMDEDVVLDGDI